MTCEPHKDGDVATDGLVKRPRASVQLPICIFMHYEGVPECTTSTWSEPCLRLVFKNGDSARIRIRRPQDRRKTKMRRAVGREWGSGNVYSVTYQHILYRDEVKQKYKAIESVKGM